MLNNYYIKEIYKNIINNYLLFNKKKYLSMNLYYNLNLLKEKEP